jgi:hypothetical protein
MFFSTVDFRAAQRREQIKRDRRISGEEAVLCWAKQHGQVGYLGHLGVMPRVRGQHQRTAGVSQLRRSGSRREASATRADPDDDPGPGRIPRRHPLEELPQGAEAARRTLAGHDLGGGGA